MHRASAVMAAGADFRLMGPNTTMLKSTKPVVSVCAVRTGAGKSQTTRRVSLILRDMGYRVAAVRHPMPYGNLVAQKVQRLPIIRTWTNTNAPSKSGKSTSRTSITACLSTRVWIMKPSCARPNRKWISSSGMAVTMTSPSTGLTCRSLWVIRTGQVTSAYTTR